MKKFYLYLLAVMVICLPFSAWAAAPNVVPSLQEWTDDSGTFSLAVNSRICVDSAYSAQLTDTANVLKEDLLALNGRTLTVINTTSPAAGDFYLTLNCSDSGIGNEGYLLEIGNYLTIRAKTADGAFYGTRTVLQILKQDAAKINVPKGTARDYPKYRKRALMIDVARKYFQIGFLEDYVKLLAWLKMNDFHIHWSDNESFRLVSDTYPGLASAQNYSKAQVRALQDLAKKYHLTITPEIDTPGHVASITAYRPDLASPTYGSGYFNLNNPDVYTFMNGLYDEFCPFFDAPDFHLGTDEYAGDPGDIFRQYINRYDDYLNSKGKRARIWTGYDHSSGSTQPHTDVIIDDWEGYIGVAALSAAGYDIINSSGDFLYIVPGTSWYPNCANLYETWQPYIFNSSGSNALSPTDPHLLGAKLHNWNDNNANGKTEAEIDQLIEPPLYILAEDTWGGPRSANYPAFLTRTALVGQPPGLTVLSPLPSPTPTPTPPPGTLVSRNKTVTASSVEPTTSFTADKAVDGNLATRWASDYVDPSWIYIDLGQAYSINWVRLRWETAYGKSYKIQVSSDAANWTDVYSTTTSDGGIDDLNFTPVSRRYIRMYGIQRATQWGYSLWEFEVYSNGAAPTPTPGPTAPGVAYWKFDEGSGTTAADSWGGNTGTLNGPVWVTGKNGSALYYDGTNDYVNVVKADLAVPWTAAMWVKREDSTAASSALISSTNVALKLEQYNNTNQAGFTKFGVADYTFNYTAPVGTWVHLTYVGTSSGVSLYVNGTLQETNANAMGCPMDKIGCGKGADFLKGTLDEVKIFNRALSASEIAVLAQ